MSTRLDKDSIVRTSRAVRAYETAGADRRQPAVPYRVPLQSDGVFPVQVTADGGATGGSGADCSWTYTVRDIDGHDLADGSNATATHKTPIGNPRMAGVPYSAAQPSDGACGYYDHASPANLVLLTCKEVPYGNQCAAGVNS